MSSLQQQYGYRESTLGPEHVYLLPAVNKFIDSLPAGSTVLDIGCGSGAVLSTFANRGWRLYGTDFSSSGIQIAQEMYRDITFIQSDVSSKSLPAQLEGLAGSVDLILSTEVIEHVYNPKGFLALAYRMLKPGGQLILSTPYHGYLKNLALAIVGMDKHFTVLWDHGHIKFWSRKTLTQALTEAGFTDTRFAGAGRLPYLWKSMVLSSRKP